MQATVHRPRAPIEFPGPSVSTPSRRDRLDRFIESDPGLTRFLVALHTAVSIAAALAAEWFFVHLTGALQADPAGAVHGPALAVLSAQNHSLLVIAMVVGATVAMVSVMGASEPRPRDQVISLALMPVLLLPSLALGLAVGGHRTTSLILITATLGIGTYLRRFASRGFIGGIFLFLGFFLGFFLHPLVSISSVGWLYAEIGVGLLTATAVRFLLFPPRPLRGLHRTQRSYHARARRVARTALTILDNGSDAHLGRILHRQLVRLNEAALMIDAQLAEPATGLDAATVRRLHQSVFDIELGLVNLARAAEALSDLSLPPSQADAARSALGCLVGDDLAGARGHAQTLLALPAAQRETEAGSRHHAAPVGGAEPLAVRRFAEAVIAVSETVTNPMEAAEPFDDRVDAPFRPATGLMSGWLPGSTLVSAGASTHRGRGVRDRVSLRPYSRTAIQVTVAVAASIAAGSLLSSAHFYWALLAAFVIFLGTNNTAETAGKAVLRVLGTAAGIVIGSVLAHLVGQSVLWCLVIVLAAQFLGKYLERINYAFMVVAVTITVSQMYEQLGEFSDDLLVLRLEETTIGAAVAVATVLVVFPLRTRHVFARALHGHLTALRTLIAKATEPVTAAAPEPDLRAAVRNLDAAHHTLTAAAAPLRGKLMGGPDQQVTNTLAYADAYRSHARSLVADLRLRPVGHVDERIRRDVSQAAETLLASVDALISAVDRDPAGFSTRSADMSGRVARRADDRVGAGVVHELEMIGEALSALTRTVGVDVVEAPNVNIELARVCLPQ